MLDISKQSLAVTCSVSCAAILFTAQSSATETISDKDTIVDSPPAVIQEQFANLTPADDIDLVVIEGQLVKAQPVNPADLRLESIVSRSSVVEVAGVMNLWANYNDDYSVRPRISVQ